MKKDEMLTHWRGLEETRLRPAAVPYKHRGSTYDCDGIRITGSRAWIDAVLFRLRDLLAFEGVDTRLQVTYAPATDRETRAPLGSWSCYVQVHERGDEGKIMQAYMHGLKSGRAKICAVYANAGLPL